MCERLGSVLMDEREFVDFPSTKFFWMQLWMLWAHARDCEKCKFSRR